MSPFAFQHGMLHDISKKLSDVCVHAFVSETYPALNADSVLPSPIFIFLEKFRFQEFFAYWALNRLGFIARRNNNIGFTKFRFLGSCYCRIAFHTSLAFCVVDGFLSPILIFIRDGYIEDKKIALTFAPTNQHLM